MTDAELQRERVATARAGARLRLLPDEAPMPDQTPTLDPLAGELIKAYSARDEAHERRHTELVAEVRNLATKVESFSNKAPGRWEFRALGAALVILLFVIVGLYAQSNGHDAGKAADDAHKALAPVNTAASR